MINLKEELGTVFLLWIYLYLVKLHMAFNLVLGKILCGLPLLKNPS